MKPTKEEIDKALETINGLAQFAAIHNCWTEPVPELIKVMQWLDKVSNEEN